MESSENSNYSSSYKKMPIWQWVVIYLIIAAVVYGLIYYLVIARKNNNMNTTNIQQTQKTTQQKTTQQITPTQATSSAVPSDNIYLVKKDPTKGDYLTDFQGMTLYYFTQDKPGVSNCTGKCATIWPIYTSGATAQSEFPANISVITRADGSKQFTYKQMPLYYYYLDKKAGDSLGEGVGKVWYLVKP